jgi:hypothetical protein
VQDAYWLHLRSAAAAARERGCLSRAVRRVLRILEYTKNRHQVYTFRMRPRRCNGEARTQLCWHPLASCLPRLPPIRHKDDARILGDTSRLSLVVGLTLWSLAVTLRPVYCPHDCAVDKS